MRILFLIENLANGGAERVVSILANKLSETNDVGVLAIRDTKKDYVLREEVEHLYIGDITGNKISRIFNRFSKIRNGIKSYNPDIVISFDTFANIYAVLCSCFTKHKLVVSERNDPNSFPSSSMVRKLRNIVYRLSDGFVFQTEDAMKYFSNGIQKRGTVIPNPINKSFEGKTFEGERKKKIVSVCRLNKQKNLPLFIDIIKDVVNKYPEYYAEIYGEGDEKEALEIYAKSCGVEDKVKFMGHTNDVQGCIIDSKMYLCTSDYEGISNSILEALALGLPVVATDCPIGGTRSAIKHGENGFLFEVGKKEGAVCEIEKLIESEELCEFIGNNAKKICDAWSEEKISQMWIDYITTITDK